MHYVWIHQVRILVFDNYQRCSAFNCIHWIDARVEMKTQIHVFDGICYILLEKAFVVILLQNFSPWLMNYYYIDHCLQALLLNGSLKYHIILYSHIYSFSYICYVLWCTFFFLNSEEYINLKPEMFAHHNNQKWTSCWETHHLAQHFK